MSATTVTLRLELDGLVAIHAARAAHAALAAVPEIVSATVTMREATIDVTRPINLEALTHDIRAALATVDIALLAIDVTRDRVLPLA